MKLKHKGVSNLLKGFSFVFITLSIVEIIDFILLGSLELSFNGQAMSFQDFIFSSGIFPLNAVLIWVLLFLTTCCFLLLGFVLFKVAIKKSYEIKTLSKYLVVIGFFIMVASFLKLEYVIMINKTEIVMNNNAITFQSAISNPEITPFILAILWNFFIFVACTYVILGLIITVAGINWEIEIEKQEKSSDKK